MTAHTVGIDPACRYRRFPEHTCVNSDGGPVRVGADCFAEAHQQVIEQGQVLHAAEEGLPA